VAEIQFVSTRVRAVAPPAQLIVLADHPKLQQLYAHRLREHGFRVDIASGIEEGIVAAIVLRPRLLIADWLLADGHGLELMRRLRAVPSMAALPILFLTDQPALPVMVHRMGEGPIDLLVKPFSLDQLLRKVERWTAEPGAARQPNGGAAVAQPALARETRAVIEELIDSGLLMRRERPNGRPVHPIAGPIAGPLAGPAGEGTRA
jgi:DNA-binding response OmpR family regulator